MIGTGTVERVLGIGGLVLCVALVPFLGSGSTAESSAAVATAAPAPSPVRAPKASTAVPPADSRSAAGSGSCRAGGSDGKRIEALYVHGQRQRNRFGPLEKTFQRWLEQVDQAFVRAAKRT